MKRERSSDPLSNPEGFYFVCVMIVLLYLAMKLLGVKL